MLISQKPQIPGYPRLTNRAKRFVNEGKRGPEWAAIKEACGGLKMHSAASSRTAAMPSLGAAGLPAAGVSVRKQPITTRVVRAAEIDQVMGFLRAHWHPNHILAHDREFLLWQLSPERCRGFEQAGLSAATLWKGDDLVGMLGAIGCRFNGNGIVIDGAWLCNLMVLPEYRSAGGCMRLMNFVHRLPIGAIGVVKFTPELRTLYEGMRYHTCDRLLRFVRIIDPVQTAQIAPESDWRDKSRRAVNVPCSRDLIIKVATSLGQSWDQFWQRFTERGYFGTHRDASYMTWRYLSHPRLEHVLKVAETPNGEIRGAAVYRVEQVMDQPVRVMRLLEVMALDAASYERVIGAVARDAETLDIAFIDHYTTRSLNSIFAHLGWCEEEELGDAILPGLFQPLVQARRNVNFGIRLLSGSAPPDPDLLRQLHIVKSDGDQDRPR